MYNNYKNKYLRIQNYFWIVVTKYYKTRSNAVFENNNDFNLILYYIYIGYGQI